MRVLRRVAFLRWEHDQTLHRNMQAKPTLWRPALNFLIPFGCSSSKKDGMSP